MNETSTGLKAEVVPPVAETEGQKERAQIEAGIADLQRIEQLLVALKEVGVPQVEILEAALAGGSSLTALQQFLVKQLSPEQMQQLNKAIEAMQSTENS